MNTKIHIDIDRETCIKCGKCVRICPASIFVQETPQSEIALQHIQTCIKCGHCMGVCPTSSVLHSVFPQDKVHPIRRDELPSPEQTMLLIKSRRSNRAFSKKPVPGEMLDQILEAAHRAPTASNMQQVGFTLVTDQQMVQKVIDLTFDIFLGLAKKLQNPFVKPVMKLIIPEAYKYLKHVRHMKEKRDKGGDPILREATTLLLIHTPKDNRFGPADANLAYQNASLMAESLGVSQFYTGFLCVALKLDKKARIPALLGISETIHAGMGLGMPAFSFKNYIDKKEIRVNRI
ncbi:nitroreductase/NAD-dependent dihydropyrimidine dehydrogenase PreA subunit [Parabacteroides sp. PF5-5]|uniref:nitroreductase family protein n=1 Tax=unclassified Parabacteroides TaxID=2649774 RepID=UPI002474C57E|nr:MULTISPECIES: nitroreductase family protein [unclassified Parabacteroides]MDH6303545.1 nitroreductase/NAD-dependent dihydropyrimidine dehydrogenase PreA subunit [Parabacteroides sp. PH5-39]MDH6314867.1 nitroreductase/NAD-dependent dihydropyrimidine dehydrogenase PreA subunit [Parabacteroides sp. PF5-13]MDH6318204.1 nitroreductase/NAD-dependent dihydropyrimidine dehydrogenase PreA subunit [Parabacteroides sp. PH5-13]MDH6321863.1 nitroreductase/NAD-dependent dihydropyrimidine dehydrogenase Pre